MKLPKDLTGLVIGRLTVIKRQSENKSAKNTEWLCKCSCGNIKIAKDHYLRYGSTKSCGCFRKYRLGEETQKADSGFNALYRQYQSSAKARGHVFRLPKEYFKTITGMDCYFCGAKPSKISRKSSKLGEYTYNGIDRLINDNGYTPDNCVPCCEKCNFLKGSRDSYEFIALIMQISRNISNVGEKSSRQPMLKFSSFPHQGDFKKVLCVGNDSVWRSPTAANALHIQYGYNTRACGLEANYALIPLSYALIEWADEIVVVESWMASIVRDVIDELYQGQQTVDIVILDIPDEYEYGDSDLEQEIIRQYEKAKEIVV